MRDADDEKKAWSHWHRCALLDERCEACVIPMMKGGLVALTQAFRTSVNILA